MTHAEVMAMRDKVGFVTPVSPVAKGQPVVLSGRVGWYEFAMHPDDALHACAFGIVVNGDRYPCKVVDCLPFINAFVIQTSPEPDGPVSKRKFETTDIGEAKSYEDIS